VDVEMAVVHEDVRAQDAHDERHGGRLVEQLEERRFPSAEAEEVQGQGSPIRPVTALLGPDTVDVLLEPPHLFAAEGALDQDVAVPVESS
jgi:hypothetical protein